MTLWPDLLHFNSRVIEVCKKVLDSEGRGFAIVLRINFKTIV
jgi:hypothetical protein